MVKVVAMGLIFRRRPTYLEVLLQQRLVKNKEYDPLYHRTAEIVGETLEVNDNGWPKETLLEAAIRGVREECGKPDFKPLAVYGAGMQKMIAETHWTGRGDEYFACEPFCFIQSMGPPQPWLGPVFVFEVEPTFEPDHTQSDGEAGCAGWWLPEILAETIHQTPKQFMGLHVPALKKFADMVVAKKFS